MTGATLESVYRMFLVCIYAVTVCLSYKALAEGFPSKKIALIGTALYCWAPWYLDTLYGRAAIGEALGYAFLPVMLLFLVRAVSRKQGKLPQWLLLAIAVTYCCSPLCSTGSGNAVVNILLHILSQTTVRKRRMADIRKGSGGDTCVQSVVSTAAAKIPCGVPRCGEICGKPSFSGKGSFSPALSDLLFAGRRHLRL